MIETYEHLLMGFSVAFTMQNLMYCIIGCFIGTLVGMLPGLGPMATISLLLPITFGIPTVGAMIMLAGIYYGASYGDNVSAITMKIPHAASIITCIDGYNMHCQGRTGLALFTAGISSFIGGTFAFLLIVALAIPLGELAFVVGPAEFCLLMLVGFAGVSLVTQGSFLNGLAMVFVGVLFGLIGTDVTSGIVRFSGGFTNLYDGVGLIAIAIGCFGLAEIIKNLDSKNQLTPFNGSITLVPSWSDFKRIIPSALRGSAVGSILGLLPGGGPAMAQFAAYAAEKKFSKYKDEIGTGCIEGVAGSCAGEEAAARTGFIPLMTIGIPENAIMALMLGALMMKGIQPGPQMITNHPDLFWGLIASMWIGNVFLVILNVPMVKVLLSFFKIQYDVLFPAILFFCCLGAYSTNNNINDVFLVSAFGVFGYIIMRIGLEPAPMILGFILGPMFEEFFRRQMSISQGSFMPFIERPISLGLVCVLATAIVYGFYSEVKRSRRKEELAMLS